MSNKRIKIFDGNLLESLICRYYNTNGIADFFPGTDFKEAYALLKKNLKIIKILRDMNGNRMPANHHFELGESFYINIIVQNLTHESVNYSIQLSDGNKGLVKYDSNRNDCGVSFAEVEEYSTLCQAVKAGTAYIKINISTENYDSCTNTITLSQRIRIIDESYLFWSGKNAAYALVASKTHLESFATYPLIIAAGSGMGKSTHINILVQEETLQEKYSILKIDLSITRNCCVRNLLAHSVGIRWWDKTPKEQVTEDNKALSILIDNYAESAETMAETLMRFYRNEKPYLFVIDDIQKINRAYIDLMSALVEISRRNNKQIYFVVGLNEDILSTEQIIAYLNWDTYYLGVEDNIIRLTKFDKHDIIAFLKHKFGLEGIDIYLILNNLILAFEQMLDTRKGSVYGTRQAVWADVKRAAVAFRLPQNVGTHSARKVYAVELMRKYGDIMRVQRILRHRYESTTLIYAIADRLPEQKYKKPRNKA